MPKPPMEKLTMVLNGRGTPHVGLARHDLALIKGIGPARVQGF